MKASKRWQRVADLPRDLEQEVQLYWAEFHTDDDGRNPDRAELIRLLQDPVEALSDLDLGKKARIDDDWQVHSTFANHGFGVYWQRCVVALMVSPLERSIALHAWKVRPPSKRPPGTEKASA